MKINLRGTTFNLQVKEVEDLKKQIASGGETQWYVALSTSGHVIGEGDKIEFVSTDERDGLQINLSSNVVGSKDAVGWWFFGHDGYTIVTEAQYEALLAGGFARARESR